MLWAITGGVLVGAALAPPHTIYDPLMVAIGLVAIVVGMFRL